VEESYYDHVPVEVHSVDYRVRESVAVPRQWSIPLNARIAVGAGWGRDRAGARVDVDLGVVLFDQTSNNELGMVYYGRKTEQGMYYLEDNRTGEGRGDDETVLVDLAQIPGNTEHIFITLNVYGPAGMTFENVENLHCRLYYQGDPHTDIIRFSLPGGQRLTGLIVGHLRRNGSDWYVETVGQYAHGTTCVDLRDNMLDIRGRYKYPRLGY